MSAPGYESYRESGIDWLGEIPSHWDVKPIKAVASYNDDVLTEATPPDHEIDYVEISDVQAGLGIRGSTTYAFRDAPSRARRRVQDGDIIVSTVRTYLRAIAAITAPAENTVVSTGFAVIRPRAIYSRFIGYALLAEQTINQIIARSVGVSYPAINASDLVRIPVSVPPPAEQAAIAAFLDRETGKIDALVEAQTRLIELLKEKRQAVISHAVTKGLDPAAPMKDSGVEWLGQVPAHWEVVPTRSLISLRRQQVGERHAEFQLLSLTLRGVIVRDRESGHGKFPTEFNTYQVVRPNDLVFCLFDMDETPRTVGISRHDGMITGAYDVFASPDVHISEFVYWLYLGRDFKKALRPFYTGLRKVIRKETFGSIPLALPPPDERQAIVAFLNETTRQLDELAAQAEAAVTLLQERRAALISAAVTGKIDVRGLAPQQAEAA
nr:restriction endonuclease subunit S [uncultured Brevundimonas sp.]